MVGLIEGDHFDNAQCLAVLASSRLGRISVTLHALPVVFPVAYLVSNDGIVVGVSVDEMAQAMTSTVVALQADGWSEDNAKRWTALAIGTMTPLRVTDEFRSGEGSGGQAATPWGERHVFRLDPHILSGRWLDT
jgi:hypothetical protein